MQIDTDTLNYRLTKLGVRGVDAYCAKLVANAGNSDVLDDLLSEAAAAMMFSIAGFTVEMSDRPDLLLTGFGQSFAAEVKHFRYKSQDSIDDVALRNHSDHLVEFGNTHPAEGYAAWDQVANVARRKIAQFTGHVPYLLVIQSSSLHSIDDLVVRTAANILDEEISTDAHVPLAALSGIVFLSRELRISDARNVYFFGLPDTQSPLLPSVHDALKRMRRWSAVGWVEERNPAYSMRALLSD